MKEIIRFVTLLALMPMVAVASNDTRPTHIAPFIPGEPCPNVQIDRRFATFQINLAEGGRLFRGALAAAPSGAAVLRLHSGDELLLVSDASKADLTLGFPHLDGEVVVWGREVYVHHAETCEVADDRIYVESIFPDIFEGNIPAELNPLVGEQTGDLRAAVQRYRSAFSGEASPRRTALELEDVIFSSKYDRGARPWGVRLFGDDRSDGDEHSWIEIILSGSDGGAGMFGHFGVGGGSTVYNVYPLGSERGATGPIPTFEYLFNNKRGQGLFRPNWILRLEGVPQELVAEVREAMKEQTLDLVSGRQPYHPTKNNCAQVSMRALEPLGFTEANPARYFTRRFPRTLFRRILKALPALVASGELSATGAQLWFIPQIPTPPGIARGHSPNRPMKDGSKLDPAVAKHDAPKWDNRVSLKR